MYSLSTEWSPNTVRDF